MDSSIANIHSNFASKPSLESCDSNTNQEQFKPHQFEQQGSNDLNKHRRIHPTEMQRYLQNLIRHNEREPISANAFDKEKDEEHHSGTAASSSLFSGAEGNSEPPNKKLKTAQGQLEDNMLCAPVGLGGTSGDASGSANTASSTSATKSDGKASSSTSKGKKERSTPRDAKGDNFKSVDVLHDTTLIARFLTQTECAAYLRATPEAVSYHCSKGGGVCNGLNIRPSQPSSEPFGLFDGAEKYRPKERPQLNKESVKILKEWLLSPEHIENPYPNQLQLNELAERTGLDRPQLKHWFNNARKRILKPYLKETGQVPNTSSKGKKSRIKRSAASDGDAITMAIKNAAAAVNPTSSSVAAASAMANNPFQDDGPKLTEADDMPHSSAGARSQSLFGNYLADGGGHSALDALRTGSHGNCLSRDSLFGRSSSMGLGSNNDQDGLSSLSGNLFTSSLGGFGNGGLGRSANGGSLFSIDQNDFDSSTECSRSNAVFKQQVASMAMTEANTAFHDAEAAYGRAKELYARSSYELPAEQDPVVVEANTVAKRYQTVAVFKLKVSQRANEEAAKAYARYQAIGGGMDINGDSGLGEFSGRDR